MIPSQEWLTLTDAADNCRVAVHYTLATTMVPCDKATGTIIRFGCSVTVVEEPLEDILKAIDLRR